MTAKHVQASRVTNGIMGTFHFDKNGDITPTKAISIDKLSMKRQDGSACGCASHPQGREVS